MTQQTKRQRHGEWRDGLLAGTAALALLLSAPALAQQSGGQQGQAGQSQPSQAPSQQPGSQQSAVVGQIRTAEQALRQAQGQLAGGQQANIPQARTAVESAGQVLSRVPQQMQGQDAFRTALREVNDAQNALQGDRTDQQRAATQLREAADALGTLAGRMGGSADASGAASRATGGNQDATRAQGAGQQRVDVQQSQPQVNVQQPAPQITVQQQQPQITVAQPPPQVTIQQPPPQVNIQQPEPRVTVQQAQPQVRVQQAEPQVNVQQQGQPQVTVQRQGEPQVTTQGQDGQRQGSAEAQGNAQRQAQQADQRTGASSATPAPAQSGGSQPQQAAASPAAGVPLQSVQSLVGTNVVGSGGRDAGEVRNLLIDNQGRVRAAVVEWGGFLGLGTREALVPIERIQLGQGNERARLNMTREELEALPRYDRGRVADYGRERGWGEGLRLFR